MEPSLSHRPWWHRLRLSVRGLMLLVLVIGAGLGWFIRRATVQRDAVKAIVAAGGNVKYDFQLSDGLFMPRRTSPGPRWLVRRLGFDFFADVKEVTFGSPRTDAVLAHVGRLHRLERLHARSMRVTDAGLAHLAGLSELRSLSCYGGPGLTDAGLAHLAGLKRLEGLSIEDSTGIQGPGLAHLAGLSRLKFLCISIRSGAGLPSLSRLAGLRTLFIHVKDLNDAAFVQLARLTWLNELACGGQTGSDSGMTRLRALDGLDRLQVHGPWFTDAGLAPVSEMVHLSDFFVSDETNVTDGGLNRLQQQRPALRIGINGTGRGDPARLRLLRGAVGPGAIAAGPRTARP